MGNKGYTKRWLIWDLEIAGGILNHCLACALKDKKLISRKQFKRLEGIFKDLREFIESETGRDYWEKVRSNKGKEFEKFLKSL